MNLRLHATTYRQKRCLTKQGASAFHRMGVFRWADFLHPNQRPNCTSYVSWAENLSRGEIAIQKNMGTGAMAMNYTMESYMIFWVVEKTIWKMIVNFGSFPQVRGINKKYLKPPPRANTAGHPWNYVSLSPRFPWNFRDFPRNLACPFWGGKKVARKFDLKCIQVPPACPLIDPKIHLFQVAFSCDIPIKSS